MLRSDSTQTPRYIGRDILGTLVVLVCVSISPLLYIYANNTGLIPLGDLLVPLVIDVTISLVLGVLITFLVRDLLAGLIITTAVVILFFSYGHVYLLLANASEPVLNFLGSDLLLIPIWVAILILAVVLTFKSKHGLRRAMPAILMFSIALIAPQLFQIGSFIIQSDQYSNNTTAVQSTDGGVDRARVIPLPDVYYIILDGYGRDDVLKQNFNYDNSEFTRALKQRGFYVAEQSFSNYPLTYISTTSALNMDYHDPSRFEGDSQIINIRYQNMTNPSKVTDAFASLGYNYSRNKTPPEGTSDAGSQQSAPPLFDSEFFYIVTKSSLLGALDRLQSASTPADAVSDTGENNDDESQSIIERRMQWLPEYVDDHSPTFIFAHYLSPHPPYDFTTSIYESKANTIDSAQWLDHDAYVREIQSLNPVVLKTIDEILARSRTPPIIIIQGDHGPATKLYEQNLSWNIPAGVLAGQLPEDVRRERFAILNAYYGPPEMLDRLYPSISPVNSFRVVLSYLTTHEYPLLPDRSFIATYLPPIEYIEVPELHQDSP